MSELIQSDTELKTFVESFFKSLGATLSSEGNTLIVSKVPKEFESLLDKKAPYRLRFTMHGEDNSEFITKGSLLLKAITTYLEERGQTTLIKIPFERDYKTEVQHYLTLKNAEIQSFSQKATFKGLARFSIATTLQYLNEKEQITNHIYIENGSPKEFNLDRYSHVEGKKEEVPSLSLKSDYELAKSLLKQLISKRVDDTIDYLTTKLEKETERVKDHYEKQKQEFHDSIRKLEEQKLSNEKLLSKSKETEVAQIRARIQKIDETLRSARSSDILEKLSREEDFFVSDEKQKHSLKINNKLINTSIIYYPVFSFEFFLKSSQTARKVEIGYDPMKDSLTKTVQCDSCAREIREIYLCSSGHITCANCLEKCMACNSPLCLSCSKKSCDFCSKKLCKKCTAKCHSCWKNACVMHINKDYMDEKQYCVNCIGRCENCNRFVRRSRLQRFRDRDVCGACLGLLAIN